MKLQTSLESVLGDTGELQLEAHGSAIQQEGSFRLPTRSQGQHRPHAGANPTSFYVDCRLYRVTADEAERARQTIGKALPELPAAAQADLDASSGKAGSSGSSKDKGGAAGSLFGAAASAASALGDVAGPLQGGSGELSDLVPDELQDVPQTCAQLQGAFAQRMLKTGKTDKALFSSGMKDPSTLVGMESLTLNTKDKVAVKMGQDAPGAIWVLHSPTETWFRCFLDGKLGKAKMRCSPHYPKEFGEKCGLTKCDMDRTTFKTVCLEGSANKGFLTSKLLGGTKDKCVYMGHSGEMRPNDVAGKPASYGVFILSCPDPAAAVAVDSSHRFFQANMQASPRVAHEQSRSVSVASFL